MNLAPSRKIKFAFEFLFSFYVLTFLMKGYNIFTCIFYWKIILVHQPKLFHIFFTHLLSATFLKIFHKPKDKKVWFYG